MDYGNILSRAWKITWNHKILWIFGFLAGFGTGAPNFRNRFDVNGGSQPIGPGYNPLPPELQRQLERPEIVAIALAIVCVFLIIGLALFILSVIARGGLIGGIQLAEDKGQVAFGEAWAIGLRYFWRMLGMTIVLIAPALLFGLLAAGVVLLTFGLGALCILPLLCAFIILYIPFSVVIWLGQIGIIVDDLSVFSAVSKGWELLKTNVGPVIVLGLILFVIGLVIGLVALIPLAVIAAPVLLAFLSDPNNPNIPLLIGAGLALLCLLPILWLVSSVVTTWVYSTWTLAYRHFTGKASTAATPQPPTPDSFQPA